jgi:hypothetical protein
MIDEKQNKRNKRKNKDKERNELEEQDRINKKDRMDNIIRNYLNLDPNSLSKEIIEKIQNYYLERVESAIRLKEENNIDELYDLAEISVIYNNLN